MSGLSAVALAGLPAESVNRLREEAVRIHAALGVWPEPAAPVRVVFGGAAGHTVAGIAAKPVACADATASATPAVNANANDWYIQSEPGAVHLRQAELHITYTGGAALAAGDDAWQAALLAFAACGFAAPDALALALAWQRGDETRASDPWPSDLTRFPRVANAPKPPAQPFAPCPAQLGIYPVLPDAAWVERMLAAGARTVQLRVKQAAPEQLRTEIERAVAAGRRYPDACVFINDHWQLALEAGAYGVHLGQEDLTEANLEILARAGLRLGLSSHGYYEILLALQMQPSYLAFGPIFSTTTKQVAAPPQGLVRLARYVALAAPRALLVAIGGIDEFNIASVRDTGVGSAAVVGAVTSRNNPELAFHKLKHEFGDNRAS